MSASFNPSLAKEMILVTQYHFSCMYAVCIWDWIISLPNERRYIWKSKWTLVKGLYLFTRYYVLAVVPYLLWAFCTNHEWSLCRWAFKIPVIVATPNQLGAEAILLVRTYAFFGRDKRVLAVLVCMILGLLSYQLYVATSAMLPLPFLGETGPCFPMSRPGEAQVLGFFVAPLAFDTIITIITLAKAYSMRQRNGSSSQIIQVFLKEGFFYYFLISGANLMNGIFYFQPHSEMSAIMIPLSVMLSPVLACRMIIDIRARADHRNVFLSGGQSSGPRRPAPAPPLEANPGATTDFAITAGGDVATQGIELGNISKLDDADYKDSTVGTGTYHSVQLPYEHGPPQVYGGIRVDVEKGVIIR
ncbi:hypothetical protein PENSPDRAFT_682447 [Peniophora sp. CONT]|nr:hypothetical protein PENSPDRAFT_682447 [Peniophora sp. CONT]